MKPERIHKSESATLMREKRGMDLMHRIPDLMRQILFAVEADDDAVDLGWVELKIEGYTDKEISYNVQQLGDAGYLLIEDLSSSSGYEVVPKRLTSAGHDM